MPIDTSDDMSTDERMDTVISTALHCRGYIEFLDSDYMYPTHSGDEELSTDSNHIIS